MEHANRALIMTGGMLFAVMIMSLVAYVFGRLTTLPTEEDIKEKAKQTAAFNSEYTAYDKKIMYGVDVISVLNKALSNNEKYINEDSNVFLGGGYNTDFAIDIQITLKTNLEESVRITRVQKSSTGKISEENYVNGEGPVNGTGVHYAMLSSIPTAPKFFTAPSSEYQTLIYGRSNEWNSWDFVTKESINTNVSGGTPYHLLGSDGENPDPSDSVNDKYRQLKENNTIKQLLKYSTVMLQTIKNRTGDTMVWSQATWKPAIYDLKTRKFKCVSEETVVSEKTGRIVKMVFEEK